MLQNTVASAIKGDSMQMTDAQANQFIQQYFMQLQTKKVSTNMESGKSFWMITAKSQASRQPAAACNTW